MADIGWANSVLNKLTKKMYENGVTQQFIMSAPFMEWVKKVPIDLGTDMTLAIQTSWAEGLGNRTDRQPLPQAQAPDFLNPNYDVIDTYQTLEITGKEIERTKSDKVALANYLTELLSGAHKNFWRDKEVEAFNDGTGTRGITTADVAAGAGIVLQMNTAYTPTIGIRVNQRLDIYNETVTPAQKLATALVTAVNIKLGQVTLDQVDVDVPAGCYLYVEGNRNNEINGLGNLINDSTGAATVLGLSSTLSQWQSQVFNNSGTARNLTQELLDTLFYNIKQQNDEEPDAVWMDSVVQMVKWVAMVNRNFNVQGGGQPVKINAQNKIVAFGNAEVHTSSAARNNKIYMLQKNDIALRVARPYSPITEEKAQNIWQLRDNYNLFQAKYWAAMQLVVKSRRIHGFVGDLVNS